MQVAFSMLFAPFKKQIQKLKKTCCFFIALFPLIPVRCPAVNHSDRDMIKNTYCNFNHVNFTTLFNFCPDFKLRVLSLSSQLTIILRSADPDRSFGQCDLYIVSAQYHKPHSRQGFPCRLCGLSFVYLSLRGDDVGIGRFGGDTG